MQKKTFSRMLAALLAVLLLTQTLCITAFAENPVEEVLIPQGSDANAILTDRLLPDATETQSWEYYCTGKSGLLTKEAWGSVDGFTVTEGKYIKTTYTFPALAANDDGQYQVRVVGTTKEYTIDKKAKLTSGIELNTSASVALVYGEDGTLDAAATEDAIVKAVVKSVKPADAALTVEYYATATSGSLGSAGKDWMPIAGGKSGLLTYPAISAGEQKLRISWDGDESYSGFEQEVTVTMLERGSAPYECNDPANSVKLVYNDDLSVDYAQLKTDLFSAVIKSSDVLTAENVTMEYYATATTGAVGNIGHAWVSLAGDKVNGLTYPGMGEGTQKLRISWPGNAQYLPTTVEAEVTVLGRSAAPYTLNDPIGQVKLVYDESIAVDFAALRTDLFAAIVKESDVLTAENVTMEYYATATTGSLGDAGKDWAPLEGGKVGLLTYPAIPEGEQQIRLTYAGDKNYAKTEITVTVDIKGREKLTFDLNEGPYEVPLVFTAEQGYDYDATAKKIYDAVVKGTSPIDVDFSEITVTYDASAIIGVKNYQPLDNSTFGTKKFGEGTWNIRFSWSGSREVAPGEAVVSVTMTDSRLASSVALKEGVSFTYNKDLSVMKQAILDSVIDWENSDLPSRDSLSVDDFTFTYYAQPQVSDKTDVGTDTFNAYVPFEGASLTILGSTVGYPQIGAGEQQIRVSYNGGADYKPSAETDGTVTINKASVKVHVKSASMYVSEAANGLDLVTTDPVDNFDTYVVYAGLTSNVTTALYVQLPARYTSNSTLLAIVDKALAAIGQPTLTELMQNGTTVGELREMLSASEIINALENIGVDTGVLGQVIQVIDKLPGIADSVRIAFGSPNHAGIYAVTAVTDNRNYKTGVGVGALVLKADKAKLVWKQDIGKISAADAANADFMAELTVDGVAVADQSSVHVLYSGFTSKWKPYSSTTTPPTEPGRYVMTVVVLGGNYSAAPITRTFQITK